ncbi:hypothetical protein JOD31_001251 [Methylopila capsulata]|uniref:Uncharacterized protein n=1 Tax=Methylopila capsulata TaxID=61654 RepID=A0ABS2T4C5_9HYPH|nr:hypothetical protein [Methylopila capsulata]
MRSRSWMSGSLEGKETVMAARFARMGQSL